MPAERLAAPPGPTVTRRPRGVRWGVVLAAVLAGTAGAAMAPDPWPAGPGRLELRHRAALVATSPVTVGDPEPVVVDGTVGDVEITLRITSGVPVDEPVEGTVALVEDGTAVRPELDEVRVDLILPDGRREAIPVLARDEATGDLTVARRPPVGSGAVLGLLGAVVVLWVTEALPLFVTSLAIPVALVVAGVADADSSLAPFFDPIIALFFGGFLMAEAMRRVGLDRYAAISVVARAGRTPVTLFAALLGVSAFLSMWMSNTAAVAVLIPIAIAVTEPLGSEGYRRATILGIAYAATVGGVGSAIGTPANPLAISFLRDFVGRDISFAAWFGFGLPVVALLLPLMGVYLWRRSRATVPRKAFRESRRLAEERLREHGRPTRDQVVVLAVFGGVMAVWLTQTWHELNTGIVALGGAVALAVLGKVRTEDLGRISWSSLITFGGGLTLGFFLVRSGTSDWLATRLGILEDVPPILAMAGVAFLTLGLTMVASNTATAAMLVPLAIPLAGVLGIDPVVLVVVVAVASSIDFALVIGTPPTLLAYSTGLYTPGQIFHTGIVLDAAGGILLVTAAVAIWRLLGLV